MTDQSLATLIFAAPFLTLALIFAAYEAARIFAAIQEQRQ